jgi:hypothetical protein
MFNKSLVYQLIPIMIATMIIGYEDIKNGKYGIFIFKLIFVSIFTEGFARYSKSQSNHR